MDEGLDLKEQVAVNVKWQSLAQLSTYLIQFTVWVILARLLPPDNFGALSIALVFSSLAMTFNELGMSSAIIQRKDLARGQLVAAFWVCVSMGVFFALFISLASRPAAAFFRDPAIGALMVMFAVKFLIDSLSTVHESLLQKEMLFNRLMVIEISSSLLFGLVAITMAFAGYGIISMAWGYFAKSLLRVAMMWRSCAFRPSFGFDRRSFGELFHFGRNIVGFKIVSYITCNVDLVFVGKLLGSTALGCYSMALNLVGFPRQKLATIISAVAFPALSRIQDDLDGFRRAYLKIVRYMAVISFPLLTGLMVVSPQFVRVVYSSRWDGMIAPLGILCVYGIAFSITTLVGIVYIASGHPDYAFKYGLTNLAGLVLAISVGAAYGLTGIAICMSAYAVAINIWVNLLVKKIIKLDMGAYFKALAPAALSSFFMAAALFLLIRAEARFFALSDAWILVSAVVSGAVIYVSALFLTSRRTLEEMADIITHML